MLIKILTVSNNYDFASSVEEAAFALRGEIFSHDTIWVPSFDEQNFRLYAGVLGIESFVSMPSSCPIDSSGFSDEVKDLVFSIISELMGQYVNCGAATVELPSELYNNTNLGVLCADIANAVAAFTHCRKAEWWLDGLDLCLQADPRQPIAVEDANNYWLANFQKWEDIQELYALDVIIGAEADEYDDICF